MRTLAPGLTSLLIIAGFCAADDAAVQELEKRNAALERRVRNLESGLLDRVIEDYLEQDPPHLRAQGGDSLLPGGLGLRVSGEVRIREEIKDRLYAPTDPAGAASFDLAHMRVRLRFDIDVLETLGVVIELQDIRTLGAEGSTTADTEGVDLKRGMIVFKELGGRPLTVEAGRTVLFYGDHRLIGHLEWFDQGRTYDGLRAHYAPENWWLDLFAVRVREVVTPDDDQWLVGLYGGGGNLEGYAILFADDMPAAGEVSADNTRFATLGARYDAKRGAWDYTGEAAFQTGEVKGDDLAAFAFALKGGYTFAETRWQPRVGIEIAYATGDDDPTNGENDQFQTLFPTNHLHYGYADLVGWSNLLNLHLRISARPTPRVTVFVGVHHFRRAEEMGGWVNAGGGVIRPGLLGSDKHLGDEVDLTVVWKPKKPLSFLFGYSVFLPGGFVEATGDDPTAHFFYLQTRVRF